MNKHLVVIGLLGILLLSCNIVESLPALLPTTPTPTPKLTQTLAPSPTFAPTRTPLPTATIDPRIGVSTTNRLVELHLLRGHMEDVTSVAFSPDSQVLASAGWDGLIILWDVLSGERLRTLVGHQGLVTDIDFSPDGSLLASGSTDETVILWDWETGQQVDVLSGFIESPSNEGVWQVEFSPRGDLLAFHYRYYAAGEYYYNIILWDLETGSRVRTLRGLPDSLTSMEFSPDGSLLASADVSGTLIVWDFASGQRLQTLAGSRLAFDPQGRLLYSSDAQIILVDPRSGEVLSESSPGMYLCTYAYSPAGDLLAAGVCLDSRVILFDPSTWGQIRELDSGEWGWADSLVFSPDGHYLAYGLENTSSGAPAVSLWGIYR